MPIRIYSDDEAEEHPDSPSEEEAAEMWSNWGKTDDEEDEEDEEGNVEKADDYEAVDDALFDAIQKASWWEATEYDEGTDITKAPRIWRADDRVPEMVQELIEEVIADTEWKWADFESLTPQEAQRLEEILTEKLTQPQGWSLESISRDLQDEFGLDEDVAVGMAADTTHSVLNESREEAYERMAGSEEFTYRWLNPEDFRTTPVCEETIEEINDKGGSVTMPTLKQILRRKAQKYEGTSEGGGTPDTVSEWKPHYGCRSTFARAV